MKKAILAIFVMFSLGILFSACSSAIEVGPGGGNKDAAPTSPDSAPASPDSAPASPAVSEVTSATAINGPPSPLPPPAPAGLVATALGPTQINLSWNAVEGATAYKIYRAGSEGVTTVDNAPIATVAAPATTYDDTGLTSKTRYYYKALAVSAGGEVPLSTEVNAITPPMFIALVGEEKHSLGLKDDGTVWSWGSNGNDLLGLGTGMSGNYKSPVPVQVHGTDGGFLTDVTAIAGGIYHSLALKRDKTVWAWGRGAYGQLGLGNDRTRASTPVQVHGPDNGFLTGVTAIAGHFLFSLALREDGTVWAWGSNVYGQLGNDILEEHYTPVQVCEIYDSQGNCSKYLDEVMAIAAGSLHSLALKNDGTVWAWGDNYVGQLGDGTSGYDDYVAQLGVGISEDDYVGQLGDGTSEISETNETKTTPVQVCVSYDSSSTPPCSEYLTGITAIAGGVSHSLALKNDGTVWGWGSNSYDGLDGGADFCKATPIQIHGSNGEILTGVTAIAAGYAHSLILKNDGTVWAWGRNDDGELGLGEGLPLTSGIPAPVLKGESSSTVAGSIYLDGVAAISGSVYHSLAIKSDGTAWAWGKNDNGQLGDGTAMQRYTPVRVHETP